MTHHLFDTRIRRQRECEHGAILPLLALLALAIVLFATLIIDLSSYANQREQAEEYARLAALGALEAHFSSNANTLTGKVTDALARANNVSGANVLITERGTGGKLFSPALGTGTGAQLIPGRWEVGPGTPGNDPCGNIGRPYPCFVPNIALDPAQVITAYQVRGQIYNRFSTKLARTFMNKSSFPVDVLATATVIPRHACFVIDISGSLLQDTHPKRSSSDQKDDPINGRGSFLYTLSSDNPGEPNFQDQKWGDLMCVGSTCPNRPTAATGANSWQNFFQSTNNTTSNIASNVTEQQYSRMHFKNDYLSLYVPSDNDYNLFKTVYDAKYPSTQYPPFPHPDPALNVKYEINPGTANDYRHLVRVDAFRKPPGTDGSPSTLEYRGPEPLRTVFSGLRAAIQFFRARRVGGDMACLMFVDSKLSYPRFVKMTSNFDYLESLTDLDTIAGLTNDPSSYGAPSNSSNILTTSTSGFELIARHLMLPIGIDSSKTNLVLGLTEALNEISNAEGSTSFSTGSITLVTDGLANCKPDGGGGFSCNNDYGYYTQAMNTLKNITQSTIQGRNITVNWVLVGKAIGGHTLNIKGSDGNCITEDEARLSNIPMVMGGWDNNFSSGGDAFNNMSEQHPFYEAAVIPRQIAVGTGGIFGVLRPQGGTQCIVNGEPSCCTPTVCNGDRNTPSTWQRMMTDPQCRTQEQQIQDYMVNIIGGNPYTLVEVQ